MKKNSVIRFGIIVLFLMNTIFFTFISAQPAFPGAEGGGSVSLGGRGGRVIEVTNLNDTGLGSFREACESSGARTIIFKVGGTITLKSVIAVKNSYLTIAGQTAPGDGILIKSDTTMDQAPIVLVECNDITIRYIRVRPGPYANDQAGDAITVYKTANRVIIDHCSLTWAMDENTEVWAKSDPASNFTWQWNIISEGIGSHSCGFNSGSNYDGVPDQMNDISLHHNLFSHNGKRNPLIKVNTADVINNIVYGWKYYPTMLSGGVTVDIIANKYVKQDGVVSGSRKEIMWKPYDGSNSATGPAGDPSIYLVNNIGPNNGDSSADAWDSMTEMTAVGHWGYPDGGQTVIPSEYKRTARRETSYPITINNVSNIDSILLAVDGVGATVKLDENGQFVANRDTVDRRIINEYITRTGNILTTSNVLSRYPVMKNGTPYKDSDHDGMADMWEITNGLDTTNADDRNETNLSIEGYTNLEVFLNGSGISTSIFEQENHIVKSFVLDQNYPNPFNPTTTIGFNLHKESEVNLSVYTIHGEKVEELVNCRLNAGYYSLKFDAHKLASGMYIYSLISGRSKLMKKMLVLK